MILGTYPLIAWGDPDDISASPWSGTNCTRTGGQADPFGGTSACLLTDTSAVAESYAHKGFTCPAGGVAVVFFVKTDDAAETKVRIWDSTGAADRYRGTITWGTLAIVTTVGTTIGPIDVGGGWYAIIGIGANLVPGNTMYYLINPTGNSAGPTTSCYAYVRNAVLLANPSQYRRFARARGGYEAAVTPAGVRDSWSYGDEWVRSARQSWVPAVARSTPEVVSGFHGANESAGVNCGVEAMLRAGWDMQALTWVPDRAACSVSQSVYLTAPGQDWQPQAEGNGDTAFDMELVTATHPGAVA